MFNILKYTLPNRPVPMRVWRGPFRGARVMMNPRASLRKALGLYEHELNGWLEAALSDVTRVVDVGANDGYFTFGCAAAFRRRRIAGEVLAIEAQALHADQLRSSIHQQDDTSIKITVLHRFAGRESGGEVVALDDLMFGDRTRTLVKLDVEGAELDVIAGAASWLTPSNRFVIEVHRAEYIAALQATFAERGVPLTLIEQQPLALLGREVRDVNNWWLVSHANA